MADVELVSHLFDVWRFAFETEGGVARDNRQRRDLGEVGDDVLADAVAEVLLLRVIAHVGERQDAERELAQRRRVGLRALGRGDARTPGRIDDAGRDLSPAEPFTRSRQESAKTPAHRRDDHAADHHEGGERRQKLLVPSQPTNERLEPVHRSPPPVPRNDSRGQRDARLGRSPMTVFHPPETLATSA